MNSKCCPFTKAPIVVVECKCDSLCYDWKGTRHCVSSGAIAVLRKELPTPSEIKEIKKLLKGFTEGTPMICTGDNDNRFTVRAKAG